MRSYLVGAEGLDLARVEQAGVLDRVGIQFAAALVAGKLAFAVQFSAAFWVLARERFSAGDGEVAKGSLASWIEVLS